MSLILDALNRARDDASPVPGLATHHAVERVAANRRQYLLWVALSVAVVVIAWLIVDRYSAPQLLAGDSAGSAAERSPSVDGGGLAGVDKVEEHAAKTTQVKQAVVESAQPVTESVSPAHASPAPPVSTVHADAVEHPAAVQSEAVQTQSPEENDAVAQLYRNPQLAEEPEMERPARPTGARQNRSTADRAAQPIDVDKMLQQAREEVANDSLSDHPVPFLIDLSQQTKDSIPSVYYLRHDYSSVPSHSTVVLNSKTLSVGGSPAPGMKIEEILPDSVVLNYQGTQFRLRALNSWVNL